MKYHRRDFVKMGVGAYIAHVSGLPVGAAADTGTPAGDRVRLNFNRDYQFALGDHPGAEHAEYDTATWEDIHLPHSFSLPYWGEAEFYVGYGWYRRQFQVPPRWHTKRVFLEFEAAFQDAEVFVNGKAAGRHKGGYTGFSLDITPFVVPGDNLLAVRLNNNWDAETAPRAGEHQFAGGIYRNVSLVVVDPVHIPYCGITVTTPQVSAQSAVVRVQTQIKNDGTRAKRCTVHQQVLSPTGKSVAEFNATRSVGADGTAAFDQTSLVIALPQLWHPDHPYRYTLRTTVLVDGKPADSQETRFGFRWFEFRAETGFFLNGEHYILDGADVHQDHAGWGNAVSNAGVYRDVQMVKDAGFNFIRGSHYPHHPAFYDACDEMGLLVWSEFCFWGTGGSKNEGYWSASAYPPDPAHWPGFEASCLAGLGEMIAQNRNHPSVIAWSMCNEVFFSDAPVMPQVRGLLTKMVAHTHALDPTRPAGIGGCQRGALDHLGDVAGYNGDGARLPEYQDPGVPNLVTEYGSVVEDRPGVYQAHWTDGVETIPPWRAGRALWCMFDHGSIFGHFGFMGIVDYFRLPKRSFYWYRNAFAKVPPPPGRSRARRQDSGWTPTRRHSAATARTTARWSLRCWMRAASLSVTPCR